MDAKYTLKCRQCRYQKGSVFKGQGWCSQGAKHCELDAPICNVSYARKEFTDPFYEDKQK